MIPSEEEAAVARDAALAQVEAAGDADWANLALETLYRVALEHKTFISDDLWDAGLPSTREDRLLGVVFRRAARYGWIERTSQVRPSRRSHLSGKPVWRSSLYGGD